jgi:streptogramin lyase
MTAKTLLKSLRLIGFSMPLMLWSSEAVPSTFGQDSSEKTPFVRLNSLQPKSEAPGFFSVDPVATNLWTFNAINMYDPVLKTQVFYVTSFVTDQTSGHTGQLIELDYLHNRAKAWNMPAGIGAWGIIKGHDGNLYMGTYGDGMLLCFDPRAEKWIGIPQPPDTFRKKEFVITDVAQAADGRIYYGTCPGAHLLRYDPHAGTVTDLGKAVTDDKYLRWLSVTPRGTVLCGIGPRHGRIVTYDPEAKLFKTMTPERDQMPGVFSKPLVSGHYIIEGQHRPGGKVIVYDSVTFRLLHVYRVPLRNNGSGNQSIFTLVDSNHVLYQDDDLKLMSLNLANGRRTILFRSPGTAANNRWYFDNRGNLLGLLVQSYVYVDRRKGTVIHRPIPLSYPGQAVKWLISTPAGFVYGGPSLGQTFFSFDTNHDVLTSYDQVNDRTGEIYYGIPYGRKLYTISYAEAGLSVFDPQKPWNAGEIASSNPRTITYISDDQYRPEGGIHLGPGNRMYIGTQPDYGLVGGALSVFDPATEKLEVYRNIIPNEEISAIGTDGQYVYCGADGEGGAGSLPIADQVHFFVWDPQLRKIVFDHAFPGGGGIGSIAAVHGHAYFVRNDELMDYNSAEHTLKSVYHFERPHSVPPESLKAASDGSLWGIFGHELARFDSSTGKMQFFPETLGHATAGLAIGADGTIYFGSGLDMWIYHPTSASPPVSFGQ